ncbi:MAG TPA: 2Fe-2S iron-sulfur cluster-binding protein, partial [Anaerolineae bacterium]|nr:2Fe-2S iron-sulfur cluster-binding protein [Anaerolineae bacterium]
MNSAYSSSRKLHVDMQPIGRRAEIDPGETLLAAAQSAGVELVAICGGGGSCATCRVRLVSGDLSPATASEEYELGQAGLAAGYRLACQAAPLGDVRIDIPPESLTTPQRMQVEGREVAIALDPIVQAIDVRLPAPDLSDLRSDASRLAETLGGAPQAIEYPVLTDLSDRLRAQDWAARLAMRDSRVVAILPAQARLLGLAVDIGTTKLAAYLVDLASGETLARVGAMNPQIAYGEDVISRIVYSNDHAQGRQVLREKVVDALNAMVSEMCVEAGLPRDQIVEAVIVGNTAMHHLFAGLPVRQLGVSPYLPAISD